MPLNLRASDKLRNFNVPVSYRIHDRSGKFLDARNVNSTQRRLDTRFGSSRFNAITLGGKVQSVSFFTKTDGTQYTLAKVGTVLYSVSTSGAHTSIKTGLSATTVHRGRTENNRHIIAIGSDGLFSWDGTTFAELGQAAPTAPTGAIANGGSLITANEYKVAITFYASSIGFETSYQGFNASNVLYSSETAKITATSPNLQIDLTNIPATATNPLIDKVLIYLKNVTTDSEYLYSGEVTLGTTTFTIDEEPLSAQTPPLNNGVHPTGGAKFLEFFNGKLVTFGNATYPNEARFGEENVPDAFNPFDTGLTLVVKGKGPGTGMAAGLFSDSVLDPFLVLFKRKSTHVYSEIGGQPKFVTISDEVGCVSHDTIQVKNGVVYFLSEEGWRAIANGRFITNDQDEPITLGNGDVDDIFKSTGYTYEVNRQGMPNTFSVYYPTLDQYITWVSEGVNAAYTKAYVYEFDLGGFKPYEFAVPATCSCLGENADGRDIVLFGTSDGYILQHSIMEDRSDVDADNTETAINAFAILPWMPDDGDFDATYNYRELILKAIASDNALTVKTYIDYNLSTVEEGDYAFNDPNSGFILDQDYLDEGTLGDERTIVTSRSDINRVGESIAIGFYQNIIDANIGLISMQVDSSKNGNRNRSNDNGDEEGGFDSETSTYYPSVSQSVLDAAESAAAAAASAAAASAAVPAGGDPGDFLERSDPTGTEWKDGSFSGYSRRFSEMFSSTGLKDTLDKILDLIYQPPGITLSASPAQSLREKGTAVASVNLTATTTKYSNDIDVVRFYRAGVLVNTINPATAAGAAEAYTDSTPFSDTISFYAQVDDILSGGNGPTTVQSNTVTYTFVYPYYYGAGAVALAAAGVGALSKYVISSTASVNRSFTTNNGEVYYFAYPASYGALSSILDENGFETFADWTLRTENITGLDGNPVSYRIYEFNNPVVAGSTDFTFIR